MIDQYPPANGVLTSLIWRKTAAGGETSLSGYDNASQALSYTPGQEQVYLNGILLVRGDDYTATNGTSITGLSALAANDFVQVNCYNNFSVASVPATSITGEVTNSQITSLAASKLTGTIANNQLANSAITINGNAISLGGSVSLPGDIESVSAGTGLTGGGTSGAVTLGLSTPVATTNGGTGLSSFTTGDLVYASGSNTLAARSIGTTGQVLTVSGGLPVWTTPASGSLTLLSTTAWPNARSLTISSIDQSYTNLYIVMTGFYPTADDYIEYYDGTNASYNYIGYYVNGSSLFSDVNAGTVRMKSTTGETVYNNADNANNFAVLEIRNYASTTNWKTGIWQIGYFGNTLYKSATIDFVINSTSAISSIILRWNGTGTNFRAGTGREVKIYGQK